MAWLFSSLGAGGAGALGADAAASGTATSTAAAAPAVSGGGGKGGVNLPASPPIYKSGGPMLGVGGTGAGTGAGAGAYLPSTPYPSVGELTSIPEATPPGMAPGVASELGPGAPSPLAMPGGAPSMMGVASGGGAGGGGISSLLSRMVGGDGTPMTLGALARRYMENQVFGPGGNPREQDNLSAIIRQLAQAFLSQQQQGSKLT